MRNIYWKILKEEHISEVIKGEKRHNKIVVCVTGCFDVFHRGHLSYLEFARLHGDKLLVGLNNDSSVSAFKGPTRPINNEKCRSEILAALELVDYVCIYQDTSEFLKKVEPDVWVKGAEYSLKTLNQQERKIVEDNGGKIVFAPREFEISTTKILEKLNV